MSLPFVFFLKSNFIKFIRKEKFDFILVDRTLICLTKRYNIQGCEGGVMVIITDEPDMQDTAREAVTSS